MNRIIGTGLASALLVSGMVATAAPASAAAQACPDAGMKGYKISNKSTVGRGTNRASTWVKFRTASEVTVSYNDTETATWSASGTAGIEAEAGVIFAKASTSFSVTVGKEWSNSKSWNYEMKAKRPQGKTKVRMRYFHEAKKFKVRKWVIVNGPNGACKTSWKWTKTIVAPVKRSSEDYWALEYK